MDKKMVVLKNRENNYIEYVIISLIIMCIIYTLYVTSFNYTINISSLIFYFLKRTNNNNKYLSVCV